MKSNEIHTKLNSGSGAAGGRWRELGGETVAYLRLNRDGRVDLMARLRGAEDIRRLCRELEQRLILEHEVLSARNRERLERKGLVRSVETEPELFEADARTDALGRRLSEIPPLGPAKSPVGPEMGPALLRPQPAASRRKTENPARRATRDDRRAG